MAIADRDRKRLWVRTTPEMVEELLKGWSRPVRLRARELPDGELDLIFQTIPEGDADGHR